MEHRIERLEELWLKLRNHIVADIEWDDEVGQPFAVYSKFCTDGKQAVLDAIGEEIADFYCGMPHLLV